MAKTAEQAIAANAEESREAVARVERRLTDDVAAVYQRLADPGAGGVAGGRQRAAGHRCRHRAQRVPDALATWVCLGALSIVVALAFLQRALVHFRTTAPDPI